MSNESRFSELDGLRGIAALWVVLYHFVGRHPGLPSVLGKAIAPWDINLWGLMAVHLFFIISGFVIFMTIRRCVTVADFAASRAIRLYPAYWVSVALASTLISITPLPGQLVTVSQAVVNATMLNFFTGVPAVEPVYLSLSYELGFYLCITAVFAMGLIKYAELIGSIWVAISFTALHVFPQIDAHIPWRLETVVALPYASLFFAGILYYKIWTEGWSWRRSLFLVLCYFDHCMGHSPTWWAIMAAVFVVFAFCVAKRGAFFRSPPLLFLGAISYPLYLIHGAVGFRLQLLDYEVLGLGPVTNLCVTIPLVIGLAALITFYVERPASRAIKKAYYRVASERE
jgi:peptidoglycan/LPS O-acetylase OafA/YrhL